MADHNFIPVAAPTLGGNERAYVLECLDSTWISSSGRFLDAFEADFARFCGVSHAVAVNNGTTALHLALTALGIGPGDEVIVPNLTYIASANAVTYCGAKPVFADCEPLTLNLDPDCIEARITPRTRAILPVHLYGHPADMDRIMRLAARYDLHVVEDAAEAHGATYRGRPVGSFGACATFSFYGNKIITTGEGGMVVTDDATLAARLRLYRGQGLDPQRRYNSSGGRFQLPYDEPRRRDRPRSARTDRHNFGRPPPGRRLVCRAARRDRRPAPARLPAMGGARALARHRAAYRGRCL
jgi:perosamine synthetase